jgi:hypothetical protein
LIKIFREIFQWLIVIIFKPIWRKIGNIRKACFIWLLIWYYFLWVFRAIISVNRITSSDQLKTFILIFYLLWKKEHTKIIHLKKNLTSQNKHQNQFFLSYSSLWKRNFFLLKMSVSHLKAVVSLVITFFFYKI